MIYAIVSADRNWGIGKAGKLLVNIPDDEKYISAVTAGHTVIMGRKSYENLSVSKYNTERDYIVLSRSIDRIKGAEVAPDIMTALKMAVEKKDDIYILGGASVFEQMLDYCDEVQVTYLDYSYDADIRFPNLDKKVEWVLVSESEEQTHFDTVYYFRKYLKRKNYRP